MSGRICRVEGCTRALARNNRMGVCHDHRHDPARCLCPDCVLRRRLGLSARQREGGSAGAAVCIYPGCGALIAGYGSSRLCRTHLHAEGFCTCRQCSPAPEPEGDGVIARLSRSGTDPVAAARELAALGRRIGRQGDAGVSERQWRPA
ncbi:MAG: hypothetical protein Tsb0020_54330 [Haliangiales bacterium]